MYLLLYALLDDDDDDSNTDKFAHMLVTKCYQRKCAFWKITTRCGRG